MCRRVIYNDMTVSPLFIKVNLVTAGHLLPHFKHSNTLYVAGTHKIPVYVNGETRITSR
jgi:hypothetical protein